jgi:hypothetical protein
MYYYAPTVEGYALDGEIYCARCAAGDIEKDPDATPILSSESHGNCTVDTGCLDWCTSCGETLGSVECYPIPEDQLNREVRVITFEVIGEGTYDPDTDTLTIEPVEDEPAEITGSGGMVLPMAR